MCVCLYVNVLKVKFALKQAIRTQRGSRGITTFSLTSGLDGGG